MLNTSPDSLASLYGLIFLLGMKHGFDADHLATIDGMTRFNAIANPTLAKYCGVLFSLGHGVVVITIALTVSVFASNWQPPEWLNALGSITSFVILLMLGVMNLHAVVTSKPSDVVAFVGFRSRIFGTHLAVNNPLSMALIGALFALSFDTVSQAVFFALTATYFGGWQNALVFGLVFTLGMLFTDGINGLWISRLINKADATARNVSRIMTIVVGGASIGVALLIALKFFVPQVDVWFEHKELLLGLAVVLIIVGSYFIPMKLLKASGEFG
jgi:high-affinity nickel-transport protein